MMQKRLRGAGVLLILVLVLAGCTGQPAAPTPAPAPTAPLPSPTAAAKPTPTPVTTAVASPTASATGATGQLPEGWQVETTEQLSIAIPPGWRAIQLSGADAQTAFDTVKQNDPRLADMIGGPEALQGAAFWAFGPAEAAFIDNLNIRRSPLGSQRVTDLQPVIDVLLPEYEKMGLQVTSTDASLRIHDLPAARVTYTMAMSTTGGEGQEVRGRQVIVATDTDLWILSFSTTPEREGEMAPLFERSAQSFEPK